MTEAKVQETILFFNYYITPSTAHPCTLLSSSLFFLSSPHFFPLFPGVLILLLFSFGPQAAPE